ncbi:MAG: polyphosphate:AMP phosphotransferase [Rhodospirillaceae bacterium]
MFETVSKAQILDDKTFNAAKDDRRIRLINLQQRLRREPCPVFVQFTGIKGAGRIQVANLLTHWMDPRWIRVHAFRDRTDVELEQPPYYRYWQALVPAGSIGLYFHAWWETALKKRVAGLFTEETFIAALNRVEKFESTLAAEGALHFKVWFHLSKDSQQERLKNLNDDPLETWRVDAQDWRKVAEYDRYVEAAEVALRATSTAQAPWHLIEGSDPNHRAAACIDMFADALEAHLDARKANAKKSVQKKAAVKPPKLTDTQSSVLGGLDMSPDVSKEMFFEARKIQETRLGIIQAKARDAGVSSVLVFEGWDAAGKGGTIRHLTHGIDLRDYQVVPVAAPTDEEQAQHYLWRFWRRLGRAGTLTVFDRSWYGRVLVEWVEGLIHDEALQRAYGEINEFETKLADNGAVVLKFWLHITPEEQLKRFNKRAKVAYKQWKLTDEDWRNREKWDQYEAAVHTMVERTSTGQAPWHLIPANSKRYARLRIVDLYIEALERRLEQDRRQRD